LIALIVAVVALLLQSGEVRAILAAIFP